MRVFLSKKKTFSLQEGKTATDVADLVTKPVLTGEYKKEDLLEASRSGNEEKLMSLLTPLNVNCHASDGRKSTPLHLAAGYNRTRIVQLLLQHGADCLQKLRKSKQTAEKCKQTAEKCKQSQLFVYKN